MHFRWLSKLSSHVYAPDEDQNLAGSFGLTLRGTEVAAHQHIKGKSSSVEFT